MIDDWLDDRIIEPEEQGVVAEAVNPPLVEYAWPNGAGIFLEHEAATVRILAYHTVLV